MSLRILGVGVALVAGLLVASCSSMGGLIGDNLPTWAGGLPPGTPPRQGEPGYDAYLKSIRNEQPTSAAAAKAADTSQPPAASPSTPPRKAPAPIDEPIH